MSDVIKVEITEDIIEASGSLCRELKKGNKFTPHGEYCMVALAFVVASEGGYADVGDDVSETQTYNLPTHIDHDTALQRKIEQFDDWITADNPIKPAPFCVYITRDSGYAALTERRAMLGPWEEGDDDKYDEWGYGNDDED